MKENQCLHISRSASSTTLSPAGDWTLARLNDLTAALASENVANAIEARKGTGKGQSAAPLVIDGSKLETLDTAGAMVLVEAVRGFESVSLRNFSEEDEAIYALSHESVSTPRSLRQKSELGVFGHLGLHTLGVYQIAVSILSFIGLTFIEILRAVRRPGSLRVKELVVQIEECGLNAVPIVFLVNFLIGIVIAYLSGVQLEYYGANIFVVDGVALAVVRELSPILVAIIAAGRSGSAFTAQIGSMKLNEEVDAIATLGLSPVRVLVVPRILALMLVMPILVFFGDIAGILGGLLIADVRLGVTGATFIDRLQVALTLTHVLSGLLKAPFFAFFIGTIGCRMGLNVENNARSVGENTTSTVVRSIVVVILLNAAFAVIYSELGI